MRTITREEAANSPKGTVIETRFETATGTVIERMRKMAGHDRWRSEHGLLRNSTQVNWPATVLPKSAFKLTAAPIKEPLEVPKDHRELAIWTLKDLARRLRAGEDPSGRFPVSHEGEWAESGNPVNISTDGEVAVTVDYTSETDPSDLTSIGDLEVLDGADTRLVRSWVRKELGL